MIRRLLQRLLDWYEPAALKEATDLAKKTNPPEPPRPLGFKTQLPPSLTPQPKPLAIDQEVTGAVHTLVLKSINNGSLIATYDLKDAKNEMGHDLGDYRVTVEKTR